ncbi:hypothetical protein K7X08_015861 [Anisodus acutangulus]|uniref:Uncharacterized protein n=1 Tax=Anisodus acutangulus TaxID=402998 RepID=A0A9Q1QZ39_9SOLA|nr:hypothetical protein K7X08_015861 [Anisodus acutangulus]
MSREFRSYKNELLQAYPARVEIQWHLTAGDRRRRVISLPAVEEPDDEFMENPLSGDPNSCMSEFSNRPESPGSRM